MDSFTVEDDLHGSEVGGVVERNVADGRVESAEGLRGALVTRADRGTRCDRADELRGALPNAAVVGEEEDVRMKIASREERSLSAILNVAGE